MKTKFTSFLLFVSIVAFSQIKGKKSEEPFTAKNGTVFNVEDIIELKQPSNGEKFAYVYESKSSLSFKNITDAAKSVRDVKNMKVSNISSISSNIDNLQKISENDMITGNMGALMNAAVSEKYVTENALDQTQANSKWKIQNFKIYTDKKTGDQIVHAIAKGNGKTIAILIEFALLKNEI